MSQVFPYRTKKVQRQFMLKSKKAIASLNRHLLELDTVTNVLQGNTWKASLKDTLNIFIGPDSSISTRLDKLYFTRREEVVSEVGVFGLNVYDDSNKENFRHLIQNAIKHIESNGVYKNKFGNNFLSELSNSQIISGLAGVAVFIFGAGNYFGKFEKEREIIEMNKTFDSLNLRIKELKETESLELKNLRVENKNIWEIYHKILNENEKLKKKK